MAIIAYNTYTTGPFTMNFMEPPIGATDLTSQELGLLTSDNDFTNFQGKSGLWAKIIIDKKPVGENQVRLEYDGEIHLTIFQEGTFIPGKSNPRHTQELNQEIQNYVFLQTAQNATDTARKQALEKEDYNKEKRTKLSKKLTSIGGKFIKALPLIGDVIQLGELAIDILSIFEAEKDQIEPQNTTRGKWQNLQTYIIETEKYNDIQERKKQIAKLDKTPKTTSEYITEIIDYKFVKEREHIPEIEIKIQKLATLEAMCRMITQDYQITILFGQEIITITNINNIVKKILQSAIKRMEQELIEAALEDEIFPELSLSQTIIELKQIYDRPFYIALVNKLIQDIYKQCQLRREQVTESITKSITKNCKCEQEIKEELKQIKDKLTLFSLASTQAIQYEQY